MTSVSKTHQRYNGADKPNSWLSDYALAVEIAGGNGLVAGTLPSPHAGGDSPKLDRKLAGEKHS
jgi:hypothetical protein